jgi:hypothetical protein
MANKKWKMVPPPFSPSPPLPLSPSPPLPVPLRVTRIVTQWLTSFGSDKAARRAVSFNHTVYGYLRGPETLARALPK